MRSIFNIQYWGDWSEIPYCPIRVATNFFVVYFFNDASEAVEYP